MPPTATTAEFLITHGAAGVLAVACCVLAWLVWRLLGEKERLHVEYRQKIEQLMERLVSLGGRTTEALTLNTDELKRRREEDGR